MRSRGCLDYEESLPHLSCHQKRRRGFPPPLDHPAGRDIGGLITAIVDSDAARENRFRSDRSDRSDRIETIKGEVLAGFNEAETRGGAVLLARAQAEESVSPKLINKAGWIGGKLLIPGVMAGMTPEPVAEGVAYLLTVKRIRHCR